MIDKEVLDMLVCPACRAALRLSGDEIVCVGCERRYPVQDGIPVLLVEEARGPAGPASPSGERGKN